MQAEAADSSRTAAASPACGACAEGEIDIRADLVVAADGRHSIMRQRRRPAGGRSRRAMDVLWFRLPHRANDPDQSMARFEGRAIFVLIDRGDYWQCAYVIRKARCEDVRACRA